jgi:hypothetical protein
MQNMKKRIHMQVGDHVRIHTTCTSVFSIIEIDEASGKTIIESVTDAPGKYPWPTDLTNLDATANAPVYRNVSLSAVS